MLLSSSLINVGQFIPSGILNFQAGILFSSDSSSIKPGPPHNIWRDYIQPATNNNNKLKPDPPSDEASTTHYHPSLSTPTSSNINSSPCNAASMKKKDPSASHTTIGTKPLATVIDPATELAARKDPSAEPAMTDDMEMDDEEEDDDGKKPEATGDTTVESDIGPVSNMDEEQQANALSLQPWADELRSELMLPGADRELSSDMPPEIERIAKFSAQLLKEFGEEQKNVVSMKSATTINIQVNHSSNTVNNALVIQAIEGASPSPNIRNDACILDEEDKDSTSIDPNQAIRADLRAADELTNTTTVGAKSKSLTKFYGRRGKASPQSKLSGTKLSGTKARALEVWKRRGNPIKRIFTVKRRGTAQENEREHNSVIEEYALVQNASTASGIIPAATEEYERVRNDSSGKYMKLGKRGLDDV